LSKGSFFAMARRVADQPAARHGRIYVRRRSHAQN
jgi:hypothetical protein